MSEFLFAVFVGVMIGMAVGVFFGICLLILEGIK